MLFKHEKVHLFSESDGDIFHFSGLYNYFKAIHNFKINLFARLGAGILAYVFLETYTCVTLSNGLGRRSLQRQPSVFVLGRKEKREGERVSLLRGKYFKYNVNQNLSQIIRLVIWCGI